MADGPLELAFSPCPNDTFVFHAWVSGQLPGGSITLNATNFSGSASANFSSSPFFTVNNSVLNLFHLRSGFSIPSFSPGSSMPRTSRRHRLTGSRSPA